MKSDIFNERVKIAELGKLYPRCFFRILGELVIQKVVGREGFEPSTNWLKANCSTN